MATNELDMVLLKIELEEAEKDLLLTRQYLVEAVSRLPKRELSLTLSEQAKLGDGLRLQAKADDKGTLFFRAVKKFN